MRVIPNLDPARAGRAATFTVLLVSLVSAGCDGRADAGDGSDRLSVVASFYPLEEAVRRVGGDLVEVIDLTPPGVEPHDLEVTPDDVEAIATADLVVYLGSGFQPGVEEAIGDADGLVLDAFEGAGALPPPPDEEGEDLSLDPHVWLDPARYRRIVDRIDTALERVDPADRATFRSNARSYDRRLMDLARSYADGLAHCARRLIVTNHAAFGYLAAAYGLEQQAISGLEPDAEPSPDRLSELQDLVRREGVTTVFTEDLVSPKVAETLAAEAGVTTAVLHTLEGLTDEERAAGEDYVSQMEENLTTLRTALGCA
jgi:zinc transport system substrate-binding protein